MLLVTARNNSISAHELLSISFRQSLAQPGSHAALYYQCGHPAECVPHRVSWAADGSRLASCSDDRCVHVWSYSEAGKRPEGQLLHVLWGHTARIWDCAFHEDIIATVSEDCTCR